MTAKKIPMGVRPAASPAATADAWVEKRAPASLKRLTFDIDSALHARMKVECARRGVSMVDELRRLIENEFPG